MASELKTWVGMTAPATLILALIAPGCGTRFEGGLANAPHVEHRNTRRPGHDVVADGRESCPTVDASDPLPQRLSDCEEESLDAGSPRAKTQRW